MTSMFWPLLPIVMVHALIFHAMPRLSRPDILFAVTVSDAFAQGDGRALVSRYRAIVWIGASAMLAASVLVGAPRSGRGAVLTMAIVAGNMIVSLMAWLWANRKARPHAVPPADTRAASLVPRDTSLPGGALFAGGPFAILLVTALILYAYSDQAAAGSRSIKPFGPLVMGALFIAMMLTMAVTLARQTRQVAIEGMAAVAEQRFRRVNVLILVLSGYGMAVLLSASTLESVPAFRETISGKVWLMLMPLMLFNFGVAFWMFRVGQGGQRALAANARQEIHGDATPDHAWKVAGLFYFNPNDPAIWVEKRIGVGYTLNVGNARAWMLIGMMLLPAFAAPLLLF